MITIGLTYTGFEEKHRNYVRWLKGMSNDKVNIITLSTTNNHAAAIQQCDGLVLSGGRDIHPQFYRNTKTDYDNSPGRFDIKRDAFEIAAFHAAIAKKIPVLGICRGLQLINCLLGGSLQQDLGPLNAVHRDKKNDKAHGLTVLPQTLLSKITGTGRWVVNSAHHQAIKRLAAGLKVNCMADDGTIEGFEWSNQLRKSFLLGVQWHPERMVTFRLQESPLSAGLRNTFIDAIKK